MTIIPFIEEIHAEHYAQIYQEDKETDPNFDEAAWDWVLDEIPPTLYINFQAKNHTKIDYYIVPNDEYY